MIDYLKKITDTIKLEKYHEIDSILYDYFENMMHEYNFNFAHNHLYSRNSDKYNKDCATIHILARGFNYRLKNLVTKPGKRLSDSIHDAPNSLLLQYVSKPHLVYDILNYLHCYIYGLSEKADKRCVTAVQFLKFEDMVNRYRQMNKVQMLSK